MVANQPDFSGWATKANLKCSDGRTITPGAFLHQDQTKVPLVWQHARNEPANILGHALLENKEGGVYCHGFFNDSPSGQNAKVLVEHEDINSLSIYANRLTEKSKVVTHGQILEVSLVVAGANPGALIDFVNIQHADDSETTLDDEAIIYTGFVITHGEPEENEEEVTDVIEEVVEVDVEHADAGDKTIQQVFDGFSEEQKNVVYYMLGQALKGDSKDAAHSDEETPNVQHTLDSMDDDQKNVVYYMVGAALEEIEKDSAAHADTEETDSAAHADTEVTHSAANADDKEGITMTNVFEQTAEGKVATGTVLTHAQQAEIFKQAARNGSLRHAVENFATAELQHGIEDIDTLFPDAKSITSAPEWYKRRTEWVAEVMTGTRHTPFSRIKSLTANLTLAEARAKGYVKGNLKKEEFFRVSKRVTTPQTVYKKQQLDRDDILDITDFDVVAWLKGEMRLMLEEEIARAVLLGDGRAGDDEDKINEANVRPIATDNGFYVTYLYVNLGDASSSPEEVIDALVLQRRHYRGSGSPTFYTSEGMLSQFLLIKDTLGRRIYSNESDVAAAIRVSKIVTVEVMDEPTVDVVGIMVNLQDYNIGADKGGDVALFDDFDIDYNQYKYLIETRISGALVKPKSALVVKKTASNSVLVDPVAPAWNSTTHAVTVATTTGIVYKNELTGGTLVTGTPVVLTEGDELTVIAVPATGYNLSSNAADEFYFTYDNGRVDAAF